MYSWSLAAVALPAYQDYTTRAKMSEAMGAGASAKTAVAEWRMSEGDWPSDAEAGLPDTASTYVEDTVVAANGVINVYLDEAALGEGTVGNTTSGEYITFTPDATSDVITWTCTATLDTKSILPATCRGEHSTDAASS